MIKTESIQILASRAPFALPELRIDTTPQRDLNDAPKASIRTTIRNQKNFKIVDDLTVSFNTHLGWEIGPQASVSLRDQLDQEVMRAETSFAIPDNCWVVNASAGVAVQYGKFRFRIHDQKIVFRGDWAEEIGHPRALRP
jgi:hypothetical protein